MGHVLRTIKQLIGERIKTRRERLKLSQKALAELIDPKFKRERISEWEHGKHEPKGENKRRLLEVLETTEEAIFGAVTQEEKIQALDMTEVLQRLEALEGKQPKGNKAELLRLFALGGPKLEDDILEVVGNCLRDHGIDPTPKEEAK